jgi:hypothetical protein
MFNPELRYFMEEELNINQIPEQIPIQMPEQIPDQGQEFRIFENTIDYIGGICTITVLLVVSYNRLWILTGFLTPNQEWLELSLLTVSIGLFVICKVIADFILNDLNDSFSKLKNQNEEKDRIIEELEKKIKQKDSRIDELNYSNKELTKLKEALQDENYQLLRENDFLKHNLVSEIRKDDEEFANIESRLKNIYDKRNISDEIKETQEIYDTWFNEERTNL